MLTISIKNNISELNRVVDFIDEYAALHSINEGDVFDINLVIDELCSNIIKYGGIENEDSLIDIQINNSKGIIEIVITDEGKEFNPLEYEVHDINLEIDKLPIGNLGILLVKSKVDEISYHRKGNKNILSIKKKMET